MGEGRGGIRLQNTNAELPSEQPPPPVGEGWGGVSLQTTDAVSSSEQPSPPVGEGWGGVSLQTAIPHRHPDTSEGRGGAANNSQSDVAR